MPQGDKRKYTDKQKRQAEHIEEGYEERGVPKEEAERRAWATVNKEHHGGEKPGGGGYGKSENHEPMRKGGRRPTTGNGNRAGSDGCQTPLRPQTLRVNAAAIATTSSAALR